VPLIVTPGRCHLPAELRTWGWAVQLYALRSARSWGMGDLADLSQFCRWSADELGAGVVMLNPLHAAVPVIPQEKSPYYPSSRRFRNPLYLRIEDVPGAERLGAALEPLARAARTLNRERLIDRNAIFSLKMDALERLWAEQDRETRRAHADGDLLAFATHCAIAELHGPSWRQWPPELQHPRSPAVARFRDGHANRVAFHAWLQRQLDEQLAGACASLAVMHDLAVGVDPDGADAWMWQEVIADGVRVGAPPDDFALGGQNWELAAFDPWKLRATGYRPFIDTIRAAMRHAGALRIDHVMGLFRLWWIPPQMAATDGAYVRYPAADLLDILALESSRARAWVCGEDLGTVEAEVRPSLAARDILSYRLLWFEESPPAEYPVQAVAAVTTHDLPTVAGLWTGRDLDVQRGAGMEPNVEDTEEMVRRLLGLTGLPWWADAEAVVTATYSALATAPSMVLLATLDDALGVSERPNVPGTVAEWPNWQLALPATLEEVMADSRVRRLAAVLRQRRPGEAARGE